MSRHAPFMRWLAKLFQYFERLYEPFFCSYCSEKFVKFAFYNGADCYVRVSISRVTVGQSRASGALDSHRQPSRSGGAFEMQRKLIKLFSIWEE